MFLTHKQCVFVFWCWSVLYIDTQGYYQPPSSVSVMGLVAVNDGMRESYFLYGQNPDEFTLSDGAVGKYTRTPLINFEYYGELSPAFSLPLTVSLSLSLTHSLTLTAGVSVLVFVLSVCRFDYVLHTTVEVLPTGKGSSNPPTKEDDNSSSTELIIEAVIGGVVVILLAVLVLAVVVCVVMRVRRRTRRKITDTSGASNNLHNPTYTGSVIYVGCVFTVQNTLLFYFECVQSTYRALPNSHV